MITFFHLFSLVNNVCGCARLWKTDPGHFDISLVIWIALRFLQKHFYGPYFFVRNRSLIPNRSLPIDQLPQDQLSKHIWKTELIVTFIIPVSDLWLQILKGKSKSDLRCRYVCPQGSTHRSVRVGATLLFHGPIISHLAVCGSLAVRLILTKYYIELFNLSLSSLDSEFAGLCLPSTFIS